MTNVLKRNNVKVRGSGSQSILFVHGFGCDQNVWRDITPAFESRYKIVLLDLVGAGDSDLSAFNPKKYDTLSGYADDIIELINFLGLKDVIFVGHSVSAIIGAIAEIKVPILLDKLIMIGPSPCYINDKDYVGGFDRADIDELLATMESNYLGWSSSLAPAIMGNGDRPELGAELTQNFCRTDPDIAQHFARVTFLSDNRKDLRKVQAKTLVLQCDEDIIAPETVGIYVCQQINNCEFVLLEATGHCPHMSAPEEVIASIDNFLTS